MWRTYRSFVALAVFAILKLPVASAADLPEAIARCADVADNLERLACYDRQNPPRHATATPKSADADFGATEELLRKQAGREPAAPRTPDRIIARVTKVSERPGGDTLIELDNGQVWQQTQRRIGSIAEPGDEVTVSKGTLGSYFLIGKTRLSTRVKRVR